jgi:prolyl-tRNA synthetase
VPSGVAGANETDHHVKNVRFGRDYDAPVADIRLAAAGDGCPRCDGGTLAAYKGIEAGHIFILGTKYSQAMNATYLDEKQQKVTLVMGCYGIGVSRLVATTIEQHNDAEGLRWPMAVAPYHVHLVTIGKEDNVLAAARELHDSLEKQGVEVLWDDRDERPGVKFKDADLIGIPIRVTLGARALAAGNVEVKPRTEPDPKKAELVPLADAVRVLGDRVRAALAAPAKA